MVSLIIFDLVLKYTGHPLPDSEGCPVYERFNFSVVCVKYLNSYYIANKAGGIFDNFRFSPQIHWPSVS